MKRLFLALPVAFALAPAAARNATQACVVILDLETGTAWRSDAARCATRLSPASTFKIPHALVALETGVVSPETIERWDGDRHPDFPKWDADHTVASALKPSVVWFFQRIAPRVGAPRMRAWLERLRYGNARTDGEVTMYWLDGTLEISPDEQAAFLREFYLGRLPVRAEWQRLVRDALEQPAGTVENASGAHALEGRWPAGATWNVKTGRTEYDGRSVSWLVGRFTAAGRAHVFAAAAWREDPAAGPLDAARAAAAAFTARGFVAP